MGNTQITTKENIMRIIFVFPTIFISTIFISSVHMKPSLGFIKQLKGNVFDILNGRRIPTKESIFPQIGEHGHKVKLQRPDSFVRPEQQKQWQPFKPEDAIYENVQHETLKYANFILGNPMESAGDIDTEAEAKEEDFTLFREDILDTAFHDKEIR